MPLKLDPYISPLDDYSYNLKLIYNYFNTSNCDYQVHINENIDFKNEKLEEIILTVCELLDIPFYKIIVTIDGVYRQNLITVKTDYFNACKYLFLFADNMQNNFFEKNITHYFLSMTNRLTWDRICTASFLYKYYRLQSKIKFPLHEKYVADGMGIDKSFSCYFGHSEYVNQITSFLQILPVDDVQENWSSNQLLDVLSNNSQFNSKNLYTNIAIEIVNNKTIYSSFNVDEKIVRPIAYYTAFVVMASKNYLVHLKTLGFKTFDSIWDESYDKYEGKQRLEKIYETLNEIAKIDLKTLHKQTHDICVYNKSVLDSYQWKNKFKDIKV